MLLRIVLQDALSEEFPHIYLTGIFPTTSPTHTRPLVVDPYSPCEDPHAEWRINTNPISHTLSEVMKFYPPLKLRVFVDDITALVKGRNKDVAEMAKKVMKKLKEEVEKKGL